MGRECGGVKGRPATGPTERCLCATKQASRLKNNKKQKGPMAGVLPAIVSEAGSRGSLPSVVTLGTAASPSSPCRRGWGQRPG